MKLEIARSLFLIGALVVVALALVAWELPRTEFLSAEHAGQCPTPRVAKVSVSAKPDHDLLLFMFGLSQGLKPQS